MDRKSKMTRTLAMSVTTLLAVNAFAYLLVESQDEPASSPTDTSSPSSVAQADQGVQNHDLQSRFAAEPSSQDATSAQEALAAAPAPVSKTAAPVSFDPETAPSLEDQLHGARLRVATKTEALEMAKQEERIRYLKQQRQITTALNAQKLAKINCDAYCRGEAAREHSDLQGEVSLGYQRADLAATRLHWSERLAEKGLVSQYGLESDRSALETTQEKFKADKDRLQIFEGSAHQRQISILDRRQELANAEVDRVHRVDNMQKSTRDSNLGMRQAAFQLATNSFRRLEKRLAEKEQQASDTTTAAPLPQGESLAVAVRAEIPRSLPIKSVVGHGDRVAPGDLIIEFDASELQLKNEKHQSEINRISIIVEQVRENITLLESQSEFDQSQAQLGVTAAHLALAEYTEDTYPQQRQTLTEQIDSMSDRVEAAERRVDWSQRVIRKGYVTQMQVDEDELELAERKHDLDQLEQQLRILEQHDYQRQVTTFQSQLDLAMKEAEITKSLAEARVNKARARLLSAETRVNLHQQEFKRIAQLIAGCQIRATESGQILHQSPLQESAPYYRPEVGAFVRPQQVVLTFIRE